MKQGKIILACILAFLLAMMTGCGSSDTKNEAGNADTETKNEADAEEETASGEKIDQLAAPVEGETIAVMKIKDYGTVKLHFFKDAAPKAVENFVTHAKKGYYDGLTFHRVINDFMIQGGDPTGSGSGGESIWGEDFEDEISPYLIPLRGALCMANAGGGNTNGSQFFLVQSSKKPTGDAASEIQSGLDQNNQNNGTNHGSFDQITADNLSKVGGCSWLAGGYTVFGQVYDGLDVVDKIAAVKTSGADKPVKDVVIESVKISTYKE